MSGLTEADCPVCGRRNPLTGVNGGDCLRCSMIAFGTVPYEGELLYLKEEAEAAVKLAFRSLPRVAPVSSADGETPA